jgi:hypothetical protein
MNTPEDGDAFVYPDTPPAGLGEAGSALWADVMSRYDFSSPADYNALAAAARMADQIARLEDALAVADVVITGSTGQDRVHPLIGEVRAHRLAQQRILSALFKGTDDAEEETPEQVSLRRTGQAQRAARARWSVVR